MLFIRLEFSLLKFRSRGKDFLEKFEEIKAYSSYLSFFAIEQKVLSLEFFFS